MRYIQLLCIVSLLPVLFGCGNKTPSYVSTNNPVVVGGKAIVDWPTTKSSSLFSDYSSYRRFVETTNTDEAIQIQENNTVELPNGTELSVISYQPGQDAEDGAYEVRVLDGDYKDRTGWIFKNVISGK